MFIPWLVVFDRSPLLSVRNTTSAGKPSMVVKGVLPEAVRSSRLEGQGWLGLLGAGRSTARPGSTDGSRPEVVNTYRDSSRYFIGGRGQKA